MKASETKLQEIFEVNTRQYMVPLFQRRYSWERKEWDNLWKDLIDLTCARTYATSFYRFYCHNAGSFCS